ncbi:MAG: hypothetical protein ACR2O6_09690 [Ilumatobacteraceae bacterium]
MFGSQVLETIIGLVLMFFVLALGASAAVEAISRLLSWRAENLEKAIKAMLVGTGAAIGGNGDDGGNADEGGDDDGNDDDDENSDGGNGDDGDSGAGAAAGGNGDDGTKGPVAAVKNWDEGRKERNTQRGSLADDATAAFNIFASTSIWESAKAAAGKKIFSNSLFKGRKNPWKKPSYLSAKSFGDIIGELITQYGTIEELKAAIDTAIGTASDEAQKLAEDLPKLPSGLAKRLNHLLEEVHVAATDKIEDVVDEILTVKSGLETWFDATMDRVSGGYKRWSSALIFAFGLAVAIGANASAFHVAQNLWTDPVTREAVAQVAGQVVEEEGIDASDVESVAKVTETLEELQLPIGWRTEDLAAWGQADEKQNDPGAGDWWQLWTWTWTQWAYLAGWILTALLVMQGAPFWFDVLTKAVSLRSAGAKPPTAANDSTSATAEVEARKAPAGSLTGSVPGNVK